MESIPLYIARDDHAKLRLLLNALPPSAGNALLKLRAELARAVVIDPAAIPADVVVMGSLIEYEDLSTGETERHTLVFPEQADIDAHRLSVLAPIGTALIGCRAGQIVDWFTPGGVRQLKIHRVTPPVREAAGSPRPVVAPWLPGMERWARPSPQP